MRRLVQSLVLMACGLLVLAMPRPADAQQPERREPHVVRISYDQSGDSLIVEPEQLTGVHRGNVVFFIFLFETERAELDLCKRFELRDGSVPRSRDGSSPGDKCFYSSTEKYVVFTVRIRHTANAGVYHYSVAAVIDGRVYYKDPQLIIED